MPTLAPGDLVVIDNLSSQKSHPVREAIEAVGARLLFLPRYSPDFNNRKAFSKLKALLRKAAERTVSGLASHPAHPRQHHAHTSAPTSFQRPDMSPLNLKPL